MHRAIAVSLATLVACSSAAFADDETPAVVGGKTYVQHQILAAKSRYPEIAEITVTGKGPDGKTSVILGSTANTRNVFKAAQEPAEGSSISGRYFVVREPFLSSTTHRLGTIEIKFANRPGGQARLTKVAQEIQASMARATLSAKNAADPYPFDPKFGPTTFAQRLTERTVAAHPDLLVMMIHATPPKGAHNVIIGSNIGRFGKQADEDDLRVIVKGTKNLELNKSGTHFEAELPLQTKGGKRIGAIGVVFNYKPGDDKAALEKIATEIQKEMQARIPSSKTLFGPAS